MKSANNQTKLIAFLIGIIILILISMGLWAKKSSKSEVIEPLQNDFVEEVKPKQNDNTVSMLLPDFTQLVAREGSAVVNIQAMNEPQKNDERAIVDDPLYDLFRRMLPSQPEWGQSDNESANFGSGVIINKSGYILTNAHVVKDLSSIKVTLTDRREYAAKLIGADDKSDIALLKIEASDLPVATLGNSGSLKTGEWVVAIGAPFGFENSVTAGIVSAKNRALPQENYTPFIQTDVAINPGNSGGPLYNLKGEVIGINSQIYSRSGGFMGISFAIPIEVAINVAEQLKATGKVERGQLGIVIQEVTHDLAKSFGLDKPTGALISNVLDGSPAQQAGLQVGDIIRSVNGEEVHVSTDLPMTIGALAPGKKITLGIWRKGQEIKVEIVLGSSEDKFNLGQSKGFSSHHEKLQSFDVAKLGLTLGIENGDSPKIVVLRSENQAARAGLRYGDIIVEIAGQRVNSQEQLENALAQAGENIPILIERDGSMIFLALSS